MKNKNYKKWLIIIIVIAVIVAIAGFSYAYYGSSIFLATDLPQTTVKSPYLNLNYSETNSIVINEVLPGQQVIKKFSVTNTGTGNITYQIFLTDVYNELTRYPDLTYTITSTNNGGSVTNAIYPTSDALLLKDIVIEPDTTQDYTMTITYNNSYLDQTVDEAKTITGTIQVSDIYNSKIYGIKKDVTASTTTWERIKDSTALVANPIVGNNVSANAFDYIYPWSDIYSYNYDLTTGREAGIIGDDNFKFDGSNGLVMTYIPEFYYHRYREGDYEYIEISRDPVEGFTKSEAFSVSRYHVGFDGTKLTSQSGSSIEINRQPGWFRTQAYALGPKFTQFDHRLFNIYMLFLVEYANYNAQSVLGYGIVELSNGNRKLLEAAVNSNYVIVANSWHTKPGYYVNIISTTSDKTRELYNLKVVAIEDYSNGNITGKKITLDYNNLNYDTSYAMRISAPPSGLTDQYGMKSGYYSDSVIGIAQPNIYRGIENLYGNVWTYVDGINFKNYQAYICYSPRDYVDNKTDGCYEATNVYVGNNGGLHEYIKTLSFDSNYSKIMVASEFGGTESTYIGDHSITWTGNHPLMYGGDFSSSRYISGLFRINVYDSQQAGLTRGARIILDQ
ncbi:MAG: hypothetical protein J5892_02100 [Bacilli bacterium]|nr:hypothetical protein [Bacilli bacterium]